MRHFLFSVLAMLVALISNSATATVVIDGYTFQDNAFVDGIGTVTGSPIPADGATTVGEALIGPDINGGITCDAVCSIELLFIDNVPVNGPGADLVMFEGGGAEQLDILVGALRLTYPGNCSTYNCDVISGYAPQEGWNALEIDLSDFGLALGATISSLTLDLNVVDPTFGTAEPFAVGALNNVPVPAAGPMLMAGIAAAALMSRRYSRRSGKR